MANQKEKIFSEVDFTEDLCNSDLLVQVLMVVSLIRIESSIVAICFICILTGSGFQLMK